MNQRKVLAILMAFTACAILLGAFPVSQTLYADDSNTVVSPYTFAAAFEAAEEFTDGSRWIGSTQAQRNLISSCLPLKRDLPFLPKGMLEAKASDKAGVINEFLKRHDFGIQLEESSDPNAFYFASMIAIRSEWKNGEQRRLDVRDGDKIRYPRVLIKDGGIISYSADGHSAPVVELLTKKTDIRVFVTEWTPAKKEDGTGFKPLILAKKLTPTADTKKTGYEELVIPMIDLKISGNVDWLLGLKNTRGDVLDQAKQESTLKLNEHGFEAKSAVAFGASRGIDPPKKTLKITNEFLFWVTSTDPKVRWPLFCIRVPKSAWKDPGEVNLEVAP